jgi:hypothetical protein
MLVRYRVGVGHTKSAISAGGRELFRLWCDLPRAADVVWSCACVFSWLHPVECEGGFDGRHFCPYWHGHDLPSILYRFVEDGKRVACVYFEEEPGRRSAAKLLTKDEARRIAANIAKLEARGRGGLGQQELETQIT